MSQKYEFFHAKCYVSQLLIQIYAFVFVILIYLSYAYAICSMQYFFLTHLAKMFKEEIDENDEASVED